MKLKKFALGLGVALALTGSAAMADHKASPSYDVNKPAWFQGGIVEAFAVIPKMDGSVGPSPSRPDVTAYLVGNIYAGSPFGPAVTFPAGPGVFLTVPAHDDVFSKWSTSNRPIDAFGFWVVPGQAGVADGPNQNIRVREMPAGSLAGAPLAYAVKLNNRWYALTSAKVIEAGIDAGLLAPVPSSPDGSGFGGYGWLAPPVKVLD